MLTVKHCKGHFNFHISAYISFFLSLLCKGSLVFRLYIKGANSFKWYIDDSVFAFNFMSSACTFREFEHTQYVV